MSERARPEPEETKVTEAMVEAARKFVWQRDAPWEIVGVRFAIVILGTFSGSWRQRGFNIRTKFLGSCPNFLDIFYGFFNFGLAYRFGAKAPLIPRHFPKSCNLTFLGAPRTCINFCEPRVVDDPIAGALRTR